MKPRLQFFLLLAFLFVSAGAAGFPKDLSWDTKVYPDGFTLVTKEEHSHPACSIHLFVAVGSTDETPAVNGISHFYEHLFFKGTKRRTAEQMKSEIEDYGGDVNGATYRDYTEFIVNVPSAYADKGIDLILDGFLSAQFDPAELEKERKVVLDEVTLDAEEPQRNLVDLFNKSIYTAHPYRLPIAGTPESVKNITRDDILNWKRKYYVPSNAFLVVVGDVDASKIEKQMADLLKDVPSAAFDPPVLPKEPPRTKPLILQRTEPVNQALFDLGFLVAGLDTPEDIYPLDVLTFMLGYGRSSILNREMKDELHLANDVSADFLTQRYPSTLQIMVATTPGEIDACRQKVLSILARIRKGDMAESEIERAKTLLKGVYTLGNSTDDGKASTIGFYVSMGAGGFAKTYLAHIRKVTPADIVRVADKYLQNNYVEAVFVPKHAVSGRP